jgi:hypothetical protein
MMMTEPLLNTTVLLGLYDALLSEYTDLPHMIMVDECLLFAPPAKAVRMPRRMRRLFQPSPLGRSSVEEVSHVRTL